MVAFVFVSVLCALTVVNMTRAGSQDPTMVPDRRSVIAGQNPEQIDSPNSGPTFGPRPSDQPVGVVNKGDKNPKGDKPNTTRADRRDRGGEVSVTGKDIPATADARGENNPPKRGSGPQPQGAAPQNDSGNIGSYTPSQPRTDKHKAKHPGKNKHVNKSPGKQDHGNKGHGNKGKDKDHGNNNGHGERGEHQGHRKHGHKHRGHHDRD